MLYIQSADVATGNTYDGTWNLSQNVNGNKTLINYYLEEVAIDWITSGSYLGVNFYMPGVTIDGQHPQAQYTVNFTTQSTSDTTTIAAQFQTNFRNATLESSEQKTFLDDNVLISDTTVTYDSVDGLYQITFPYLGGGSGDYDVYVTLQYGTDCNCTGVLGVTAEDLQVQMNTELGDARFEWVVANGQIGNNDPQYLYVYFNNVTSSISTTTGVSPTLILNRWSVISGESIKINGQVKSFDIYFANPSAPSVVTQYVGSWSFLFA